MKILLTTILALSLIPSAFAGYPEAQNNQITDSATAPREDRGGEPVGNPAASHEGAEHRGEPVGQKDGG